MKRRQQAASNDKWCIEKTETRDEVAASYREFLPRPELQPHVTAFFSFVRGRGDAVRNRRTTQHAVFGRGDSYSSPFFASGAASIAIELESGHGKLEPRALLIGPSTKAALVAPASPKMVGAYLAASSISTFFRVPAYELDDQAVPVAALVRSQSLASELSELDEGGRIDRLEAELLRLCRSAHDSSQTVLVRSLVAVINGSRGGTSVEQMVQRTGVSRQYIARAFRNALGIPPKILARLTRFHALLTCIGESAEISWSRVAAEFGYADQAHMITEFKEFSSLTPHQVLVDRPFHPFLTRKQLR